MHRDRHVSRRFMFMNEIHNFYRVDFLHFPGTILPPQKQQQQQQTNEQTTKNNNNKQTQNPKQTNPPKNQQQQKQQQQHKTPDRSNRPCMRFLVRDDKYSNIAKKKKKKKNRLAPKSYEVDICHGLILLSVLINVNSKACYEHSISEFSL